MVAVMMEPSLRPSLSAKKPMNSWPAMIPDTWVYVSVSVRPAQAEQQRDCMHGLRREGGQGGELALAALPRAF